MGDATLAADELHLWIADLSVQAADYARLSRFLSEEERHRSGRLRFEELRRRFVAGRGTLRCLLAGYLGTQPEHVRIGCEAFGKPLLDVSHGSDVSFNVAHAKDLAVYAFGRGASIGVDVEHADVGDCDAIVRQFFSSRECREYRELPDASKRGAFLRAWTLKEACLKACGIGMSGSLADVEVEMAPDRPAQLRAAGVCGDVRDWWLEDMPGLDGYVGAIAVRGRPRRLMVKRIERGPVA